MRSYKKYGLVLGVVMIFSLLGTSIVSARSAEQQSLASSVGSFAGQENAQIEFGYDYQSKSQPDVCVRETNCTRWTGLWIITYLRKSEGHWVTWCELYVPDFVDNELDAKKWSWSDEYIADNCSLEDEPQTWEGVYLHVRKEKISVTCKNTCEVYY